MGKTLAYLLSAIVVLVATDRLAAGDWAHWRGPEHNGVARDRGLVDDWSFDTGQNVLWQSDIGGRATPIVLDGRVYLNCRTAHDVADPEEKIHAREQVVCWDAATGDVLWRDEFNVFQTDIPAPRVGWAAMAGDSETGFVYVHSVSGLFRCYTPEGKVVWEHSLFERYGKISGYGGRTQTPIVDEDRVIVSFLAVNWGDMKGPSPKHYYYAFDKRDGRLLWISAPGGKPYDTNYSAPLVTVIDGVRMLIGGNADGGVYAMQARTGEPLWGFRMSKRGLNASPVVDGKHVFISHGEDNIDNVDFGRVQCIDATGRGDVTETHGVWRVDGVKAGYASLLVNDGILYVVTDTGMLLALDSDSGNELWQFKLGTVGKGSPVWADGKLYVMEVNGRVHILQPTREGCKSLSLVELPGLSGSTFDEIYASPAVADGRVFLVARDRTICLGREDRQPQSDPVVPLADEAPAEQEVALVQLAPYEVELHAGASVDFQLRAFDRHGRFIKTIEPTIEPGDGLSALTADGATLTADASAGEQAGTISATHGNLTATARVRVYPPLPWKWDFERFSEKQVPPTWVRAFLKLQPTEVDGTVAMVNRPGKGRPSNYVWLGPPTMSGYTIQADVLLREQNRRLAGIGVTAHRYNLILKGNTMRLAVQSWAPHLRMAQQVRFRSDPDIWYTIKLRVDVADGQATVRGKAWPRSEDEPAQWTIEAIDPHPNLGGSPGLYLYALAESYVDNVIVSEGE